MGIHGEFVEDGRLQSLLELFSIKYTGSKVEASILAMDKYFSSLLIGKNLKIKIPKTHLIDLKNLNLNFKITYPVILKPNNAGSSIGIYLINSPKELKNALKKIANSKFRYYLIQKYLENSLEISCGCLEDKNGDFIKLPPIEIIPKVSKFFNYQAKYSKSGSIEITPPVNLNPKLSNKISDLACKIHQLLRCSSYSRSDFLIHNNEIYYLETNTLPGMTATSLLPQEAQAKGINFLKLIDFIIQNEL
jgi:D-alanine-D-alanine ligase